MCCSVDMDQESDQVSDRATARYTAAMPLCLLAACCLFEWRLAVPRPTVRGAGCPLTEPSFNSKHGRPTPSTTKLILE